ncbi:hypothetical protein NAEGRDRAFT_59249 [Naegleria gruberi]|uniref:Uncharacterized protein n=1 Tax=Naegleria gruberi TaxID=5762 RepID=D2VU24_NAEGR|nr:uncharacterized protein NAEGRDRAFT_59249 [Naegleria gruberi]EFC39679.1 hypothetical protein NAEGRDRAFT_59249 [Naegleria gruberi]|eukprot:XP_002672423.1 hypothetical protein NAEGRDRAFT_59249 [Naegleria gruberi strain NEG-M]
MSTSFIQSGKTDEGFREGTMKPLNNPNNYYDNGYDFYNYASSTSDDDGAINSNDEDYDDEVDVYSGSISPDVFSINSQQAHSFNNNSSSKLSNSSISSNKRSNPLQQLVHNLDNKSRSLNETDFISSFMQDATSPRTPLSLALPPNITTEQAKVLIGNGGTNRHKSSKRRKRVKSKRGNEDSFSSTSIQLTTTVGTTSVNTPSASASSVSVLSSVAAADNLQNDIEQISYSISQMEEAFEAIVQVAPLFGQMRETKRELFLSAYGVYLFLYDRLLDPTLDIDHGDSATDRVVQLERLSLVKITKLMMKLVFKNFINLINKDDASFQYDIELLKNFKLPKLSKTEEDESSFAKIINIEMSNNTDVNSVREKILHTILETGFVSCLRLGVDIAGTDYFIFAFYFVEHMFYSKDGFNHLDAFSEELLDCARIFENITSISSNKEPVSIISKDTQETSSDMHAKNFFGNSEDSYIMIFKDWETSINLSLNSCMTLIQSLLLYSLDSDRSHESFLLALHALDMDKNNIYALLFIHFYTSNDGLIEEEDILRSNNCGNFMNNSAIAKNIERIFKENGQKLCEHSNLFKLLEKLSIIKI